MDYLPQILTVLSLFTIGLISPGPDFLVVARIATQHSRRTGIMTALGLAGGTALHLTYCILGLAVVISKSILLFSALKYLAAGYLIWLGVGALRSRGSTVNLGDTGMKSDLSAAAAIRTGFLTNAFNPKITIFFLGLFTVVISPETPLAVQLVMAGLITAELFAWFALVAIAFSHARIRSALERSSKLLDRVFGGLLILLGVKVATANLTS